jgi:glycosyltransferase involved in cell wall biosynthesis
MITWRDLSHPLAGGSELLVDRLASGLQDLGHDVTVVCGGPITDHPYRIVDGGGTYTQYLRAPFGARRHLAGADVLIDVENGVPFFSPIWHRGPVVCIVHHVHTDQWETRFSRSVAVAGRLLEEKLMPAVYRKRLFVAVSPSTARSLERLGIDRRTIRVIENGIEAPASREVLGGDLNDSQVGEGAAAPENPRSKAGEASKELLFVSLGRLVPHKRVDLVLRAWRQVQPVTGGRLVVAGSGPELESLRTALPPGAEMPGRVSEEVKSDLLRRASLLVHAAHHEGWGIALLEGAILGTPALALDAPGVRDAIVDGVTGVLARDEDDLVEKWISLSRDSSRLNRLGEAARARARQLTWDRTIEQYAALMEEVAAKTVRRPGKPRSRLGVRRSASLLRGFLHQFDDPDGFYTMLAEDTVDLVRRHADVPGSRVLDVGGGPGYFAEAFTRAGASALFVEIDWSEMAERGRAIRSGVIGDGCKLPFAEGAFDICHSSNVIEHVREPRAMFDEMARVVRPGGLVFLAFTNWWSPFGGHETSPWHWLGGEHAARRFAKRHGHEPKNRYGISLFELHAREVMAWARCHPSLDLLEAFPRYLPGWSKPIVHVPGLREVATWNLALAMRRR